MLIQLFELQSVTKTMSHLLKTMSLGHLQGTYLSKFGLHGTEDGQLKFSQGVCFSTKGILLCGRP